MKQLALFISAACTLAAATGGWAADTYYYDGWYEDGTYKADKAAADLASLLDSNTGVGKWGNSNSLGALQNNVPTSDDNAYLRGGIVNMSSGTLALSEYVVGRGWGQYTTNNISGGSLTVSGSAIVGWWSDGHGYLDMTGGSLSAKNYYIGSSGSTDAVLKLSGEGAITATESIVVGDEGAGYGVAKIGGGTVSAQNFIVGYKNWWSGNPATRGYGYAEITDGTLNFSSTFRLGENSSTTGIVYQTGGTITMANSTYAGIGFTCGGYGKYVMNGGTFKFDGTDNGTFVVGRQGATGEFVISNGVFSCNVLNIASETESRTDVEIDGEKYNFYYNSPTGSVVIAGGEATVAGTVNVANQSTSKGDLTIDGGTVKITGVLNAGVGESSVGDIEINGGTVSLGDNTYIGVSGTGSLTVNGGTVSTINGGYWARGLRIARENGSKATLNFNGGKMSIYNIELGTWEGNAYESASTQTAAGTAAINFNGGTLVCNTAWATLLPADDNMTVTVKAGGAGLEVIDDLTVYSNTPISADESMGGIVKTGTGTLVMRGNIGVTGFLKVKAGTLNLSEATITSFDKIEVDADAKLILPSSEETLTVRSLTNNGTIEGRTVAQVETQPTLAKAVWTGARSDDVADPANWAVYTADGERVSATELPADGMEVIYTGAITDELPDWSDVKGTKVLKLNANIGVTVAEDGTIVAPAVANGWKLDASEVNLVVSGAANLPLATASAAAAVKSAGVVTGGEFKAVVAGAGESDVVRAVYTEDGTVSVYRAGGMILIVR